MLDRQHGKFVVECDTCGAALETGESDFNEAREMMRTEGWRAQKIGDDWIHKCPECQQIGDALHRKRRRA